MKLTRYTFLFCLAFVMSSTLLNAQEVVMGEVTTENIAQGKLAVYLPYSTTKEEVDQELKKLKIKISNYSMKPGSIFISEGATDEIVDLFKNSPLIDGVEKGGIDYAEMTAERLEKVKDLSDEDKKQLEQLSKLGSKEIMQARFKMEVDRDTAVRFLMSIEKELKYSLHFLPRYVIVEVPEGDEEVYENRLNDLAIVDFVTYVAEPVDEDN